MQNRKISLYMKIAAFLLSLWLGLTIGGTTGKIMWQLILSGSIFSIVSAIMFLVLTLIPKLVLRVSKKHSILKSKKKH